jgi:hypothetical protein
MGCGHFRRERGGGGEAAPQCGRRMAQRRRPKEIGPVDRICGWAELSNGLAKKWTECVVVPNCRMGWQKSMAESMRWTRKIRE